MWPVPRRRRWCTTTGRRITPATTSTARGTTARTAAVPAGTTAQSTATRGTTVQEQQLVEEPGEGREHPGRYPGWREWEHPGWHSGWREWEHPGWHSGWREWEHPGRYSGWREREHPGRYPGWREREHPGRHSGWREREHPGRYPGLRGEGEPVPRTGQPVRGTGFVTLQAWLTSISVELRLVTGGWPPCGRHRWRRRPERRLWSGRSRRPGGHCGHLWCTRP